MSERNGRYITSIKSDGGEVMINVDRICYLRPKNKDGTGGTYINFGMPNEGVTIVMSFAEAQQQLLK